MVRAAAVVGEVKVDGDAIWWAELRPEEGGRTQIVQRVGEGPAVDVLPAGFNARTAVHEYGGGAWWVRGHTLWFTNWDDQRLYRLTGGAVPVPITPEPAVPRGDRWADGDVDPTGHWIVVVHEHHPASASPAEVINEIVVLDAHGEKSPRTLISGADFVSDPRWSPDGARLCWLQWNHPDMPWDGTELYVADLQATDAGPRLVRSEPLGGRPHLAPGGTGDGESVFQPRWHRDGSLWFVSDRTDWWNLYRWTPRTGGAGGAVAPWVEVEGEVGVPQWMFARSRYTLVPAAALSSPSSATGLIT